MTAADKPFTTSDLIRLPVDGIAWRDASGREIAHRGGQTFIDGRPADGVTSETKGHWTDWWRFAGGWPVERHLTSSALHRTTLFDPPGHVAKETTVYLDRGETVVRTFGEPPALAANDLAAPAPGLQ